jgi:hypothetical protein
MPNQSIRPTVLLGPWLTSDVSRNLKTIHKLLGAFQILGGVFSVTTLWSPLSNRDVGALVALVSFSALAICAGVSMWREQSARCS